jgi:hypothetical protein
MPACESGSYSDARQNRGSVLLQRMESVEKLLTHVLSLKRGWYFDVEDRGQDHIYGASKRGRCIPGARSEEGQKTLFHKIERSVGSVLTRPKGFQL